MMVTTELTLRDDPELTNDLAVNVTGCGELKPGV